MSFSDQAYERSVPGIGAPVHNPPSRDVTNGWRRQTPPIVESLDETYEEVIAKQGREDNVSGS